MGDHGHRFGEIRETKVGEIEDNNPALFLSVPKQLRSDAILMNILKQNSNQLITHFDIYATLTDIAKVRYSFPYLEQTHILKPRKPRIRNPLIKGSSLLRPLPQPRTCDRLRIPFEYCICKTEKQRLPKTNEVAEAAAKLMIHKMNMDLLQYPETQDCVVLSLDKDQDILIDELIDNTTTIKTYQVTFSTVPGNGKFWGFVSQNPADRRMSIISDRFPRLNAYGDQAKCAGKAKFVSYCYCKTLLQRIINTIVN